MFDVLFERGYDGRLYGQYLVSGLGWTVALAVLGWCIAFVVGTAVGAGRTVRNRLVSTASRLYVEVFRNIPLLVQMFLWFFVFPELVPSAAGNFIKQMPPPWSVFCPAVICLGLYTAARVAEQVRAGIEAVPRGQFEAAAALGLAPRRAYRLVILPQALRLIIPSLTNELMGIFKNTSVALTIGLLELTAQARQISEMTFQTFAAFASATLIYLALALGAYQLITTIDERVKIPGTQPVKRKPNGYLAAIGWKRLRHE